MARRDFIISFFADSPYLHLALSKLSNPPVFFQPQIANRQYKQFLLSHGNKVLNLWNLAKGPDDELGRVAVIGFSEGGQGVRATLEASDATAIDVAAVADGIHTGKAIGFIETGILEAYIAFGKLAISGVPSKSPDTKVLLITHSSIGAASLPPGIASTTETAEVIYQEVLKSASSGVETPLCGWPCPAALTIDALQGVVWPNAELPVGTKMPQSIITDAGWTTTRPSAPETGFLPPATFTWSGFADGWTVQRIANNLHAFGWSYPTPNKTKDPTGNRDHVFQAQMVLPTVIEKILVPRWNPICGPVMGFGQDAESCHPGNGKGYFDQQAAPLDIPKLTLPRLPVHCPMPPAGKTIVGRPGDPCWTGTEMPLTGGQILINGIAAIAGGAGGYYGTRWMMDRRKKRR